SVIAYCLGITEVDPIALDLYFERFLNVKRKNPPDFDIDFCWNQRDDIYDYIFQKYGEENVALMGSMSTFKGRSILRELGKIYGLPKADIDRLVKNPDSMLNKNEVTEMIVSVYEKMKDFPNQRTIHASGVLISEKPLTYYSALDYPPKGLPTVQFDMYTAENIKLEKFDILSQRGLGHINDCVVMIQENKKEKVDVHQPERFLKDPKIAAQLRSANTIGCFYIESPAMRQLISKLGCDTYPVLVAASSIIRPGVASSGMMKTYIERHRNPASVDYIHPVFKAQLEETYGVMVYQEDVMKIGHHFGGLDLADADVLRRMMNNKYRDRTEVLELKARFFENCKIKGYTEKTTELVWMQMESFAGFSFNKAHSASYAVESYQSLFLKTYYPIEFMAAVLNNYGGFYQRKVYVNEARKSGARIALPSVNDSQYGASVSGVTIYLGFDCFLNLEAKVARCIVEERNRNGQYTSLENFVLRTHIGLEQVVLLIRCGAFRFLQIGKKELLWEAHLLMSGQQKVSMRTEMPLFATSSRKPILPKLETSLLEDIYDEIELLGFPVSESMFYLTKSDYRGDTLAVELLQKEGEVVRIVGDFVCDKTVHTKNGQLMKFGNFFDVNGDFIDTVHFPPILKSYPLQGNGVYLIEGKVILDFGVPSVEVSRCARMPLKPDPRSL
ncbi:MAG: DNA polymerase III subunit alpha, partial [Pseudopedobacter saltans]